MKEYAQGVSSIGRYRGEISPGYAGSVLPSLLAELPLLLKSPEARVISAGRNRNVLIKADDSGMARELVVKIFAVQNPLKDMMDFRRGSKARRTWIGARFLKQHGIGTPEPVAFLDRWNGHRLEESYYVAEYCGNMTSFKDELVRLFSEDPECAHFMSLLQTVADAVSAMHGAGFQHNDLGNQNIFVERTGPGQYRNVRFLDLNRSRIKPDLCTRERARDISRIYLPSDLFRVFKEMYCRGTPPEPFERMESFYRKRYAIHSRTRSVRHPIRSIRAKKSTCPEQHSGDYPLETDMWIWDERSAQAVSVLKKKDRGRYRSMAGYLRILSDMVRRMAPIRREYKALLRSCYGKPVDMKNRAGLSIDARGRRVEEELSLLNNAGSDLPVLVRFYCHENSMVWKEQAGIVRRLAKDGHGVSVALVQDRRAVTEPGRWRRFAESVLQETGDSIEAVEIGHAINRVKWGVWKIGEYRRLLEDVADFPARYPGIEFTGPAVIDFEYPFLVSALDRMPDGMKFGAMSHHLYVDRRGAPENAQAGFSAMEKFCLARAIARVSGKCGERMIVSEVNWPIKGTGVYSPVNSPYETSAPRHGDPSVNEDEYACYMIRYLLIALCSGIVDRVYWWRLVARGFGLVDDTDDANWRKRPAYHAFRSFQSLLGNTGFTGKIPVESDVDGSVHLFMFKRQSGDNICLGYSSGGDRSVELPFDYSRTLDIAGNDISGRRNGLVLLGARPVYFVQ